MARRKIFGRWNWDWRAICITCLLGTATLHAQIFTKLVDFDGPNGEWPLYMALSQGTDGSLYGTTSTGGIMTCNGGSGCGTVFKITPTGTLTTLYSFCIQTNCADGFYPAAGMVLGTDGNFYGTTVGGGGYDSGAVFRMTLSGGMTILYSFCAQIGCPDGVAPYAQLLLASDGNFYGATFYGGAGNSGTVFKITPSGALTTLHSFDGIDGQYPIGGLAQASDGQLYGTTIEGGANNLGTVFRITPGGAFTLLHSFLGGASDGQWPYGKLAPAANGSLYGTTIYGGADNQGTIFEVTFSGTLALLHSFDETDGATPYAGLIEGSDKRLYGTAANGGTHGGGGTVFRFGRLGVLKTLYDFEFQNGDGGFPSGGLVQATDGNLYGAASDGGAYSDGTLFSISTGLGPFVTFVRAAGKVGQTGGILGQGFTGTAAVSLNGVQANFTVVSDTYIKATVPAGATTGYVTVTTPTGVLTSNVPFYVLK